jgi:anti-sigma-K factor RskA
MEKALHSATNTLDGRIFFRWIPYVAAVCLMILAIFQVRQIGALQSQLLATRADAARLRESNALVGLHLTTLVAKDAAYASSQIIVAWDPYQYRGVVALQNLPAPPAGHDYQLWVLDPEAETPISAGLITASRPFTVKPLSTPSPGFAISLEPSGGSPVTTGPILFAVAPGL